MFAFSAVVLSVACVSAGFLLRGASLTTRTFPERIVGATGRPSLLAPGLLAVQVGAKLRRIARRAPDPVSDREVGWAVMAAAGLGVVSPTLGLLTLVGAHVRSTLRRARRNQQDDDAVRDGLAEATDLFAVALVSGHNVASAIEQVSRWSGGLIAHAFVWCLEQAAQGRVLSDALAQLPTKLGAQVGPLAAALVAHERHGAPIGPTLAQLAVDNRTDRRRRAEAQARRLPIQMLFPLVVCVLPAFLLLTVVPIVIETLSALDVFET